MIRLHVVAEGQTEETFTNQVLAPHLGYVDIVTDVHCVTTSRHRRRPIRGGLLSYAQARRDICLWMKQDRKGDARFTTFFDLYGLPSDFPDYEEARRQPEPYDKVHLLEQAMAEDIADPRFVPYIQVHEFEALVLVDPRRLAEQFIESEDAIQDLETMCAGYESPELIDDGVESAPSKRIIRALPGYEGRKASVGPLVAARIGVPALRGSCPHFSDWMDRLEALTE
ncbi:MAG: DUF4276 family protein [bacterium]|nr:DUF4276 family protein [bacterium]